MNSSNFRQVFLDFSGESWGTIKVGRDLGIFGSDAILSDMTLLGVGTISDLVEGGGNTTLGRIGVGYVYADWKGQIQYASPNWNGFSFNVAIVDPWGLVNLSGRQRMLSQRLVKNYMLLSAGFETPAVVGQLVDDRQGFGRVTKHDLEIGLHHHLELATPFGDGADVGGDQRLDDVVGERTASADLAQSLHLINSDTMQRILSASNGRAVQLARETDGTDRDRIEELYLRAVSRPPTDAEVEVALKHLKKKRQQSAADPKKLSADQAARQAWEDIIWVVVNTKEFLFNH